MGMTGPRVGQDLLRVAFDQRRIKHRLSMTGRQIVVNDDAVSRLAQRLGGMAADVAGPARHKHGRRASGGQWRNR